MKIFFILCCLSFLYSCSSNKDFEREADLFNYLDKIHHLKSVGVDKEEYVVILQAGFCGACTGETMMLLQSFYKKETATSHYLVLAKDDKTIKSRFSGFSNIKILTNEQNQLGRYGLATTSDMFFKIRNNKIIDWFKLRDANIKELSKKLGI